LNIHFDISPDDLTQDQKDRVLAYRETTAYLLSMRAQRELTELEGGKIQKGKNRKELFADIQKFTREKVRQHPHNDNIREHRHPWVRELKAISNQ
jgi:hypothetical protein